MKSQVLAKRLPQLSEEEAALRHCLELQVERWLYRAAVGLQQLLRRLIKTFVLQKQEQPVVG